MSTEKRCGSDKESILRAPVALTAYACVHRLEGEVTYRCPVIGTRATRSECITSEVRVQKSVCSSTAVGRRVAWLGEDTLNIASSSKTTAALMFSFTIFSQTRRCVREQATVKASCGERPDRPKALRVMLGGISIQRLTSCKSTICSRLRVAFLTAGTKSTVGFQSVEPAERPRPSVCVTCESVSSRSIPTAKRAMRAMSSGAEEASSGAAGSASARSPPRTPAALHMT
eukprot:scaffold225335_cov33-Tisochrysis_lutea.AAC.4